MMYFEFTERTGLYPSMELYRAIEDAYYDFDGNKDEFCKAYMENRDGIANKIARRADEAFEAKLKGEKVKALELDTQIKKLDTQIKKLEAQLEQEQEWKPYTDERTYEAHDGIFKNI